MVEKNYNVERVDNLGEWIFKTKAGESDILPMIFRSPSFGPPFCFIDAVKIQVLKDAGAVVDYYRGPGIYINHKDDIPCKPWLVFSVGGPGRSDFKFGDGTRLKFTEIKGVSKDLDDYKPFADSGQVQTVARGATVTLDGTGSRGGCANPDYNKLLYTWKQCPWSGGPVVLSDAHAAKPTFTAPTGRHLEDSICLEFNLVVTNTLGVQSHVDNTYILVKKKGV